MLWKSNSQRRRELKLFNAPPPTPQQLTVLRLLKQWKEDPPCSPAAGVKNSESGHSPT